MFARSQELSTQYPSLSINRNHGDVPRGVPRRWAAAERANAVLDAMVRGLVVTQKHVRSRGILRPADAPVHAVHGQFGRQRDGASLASTKSTNLSKRRCAGTNSSPDFDIGEFWGFARRAKVFGPGCVDGVFLGRSAHFHAGPGRGDHG